jgi:SAM-dependent methyltransferase
MSEPFARSSERIAMTDAGPRTDDPASIATLRSVLHEAGFTSGNVREALATEVSISRDSAELPLYLRLLPEAALSTLIKLFLLGTQVPEEAAEQALAPLGLDRLEAMGLLSGENGVVSADLELVPIEELLIACDPFREELERPDHVLGISPPALVLASLTIREPVESTLDLGCGNGLQALLAARHSKSVVAVDINPRALRFAAFNALLNGVEIDCRQGNLFERVEGSRFDLIVSNPPYVVSPDADFVYRDSGLPGDSFCEGLVRRLPAYLSEGGFAHLLASWVHASTEEWSAPLRRWLNGSGCDAILLRYATHEPLEYAAAWNRPLRSDPVAYGAALDRWSDYYRRLGIDAISWGTVVLRRRSGRNWVWAYDPSSQHITAAGDQILRLFAAQDYLAEADDQALLEGTFALTGDHRLEQTAHLADGGTAIERSVLRLGSGLRFEVAVDASAVTVLTLVGEGRPLRQVLDAAAATIQGTTPEAFVSGALPVVRRLLELGFLVPTDEADAERPSG